MEKLERRSQVMGEGRREENTDGQVRVTWITDLPQPASRFANTFKDTGHGEAQLKQGAVWDLEMLP